MDSANAQKLLDQTYSIAYEELRRLAKAVLRGDRAAAITPTTLVNEAWLKLARSPEVADTSPLHFRRIAARAMRQILVDAARRRHSEIHGAGLVRVEFEESLWSPDSRAHLEEVLTLDSALIALNQLSPRQSQLVEGHFFGGLSWAELAEILGISEATVMREWRVAKAWLASQMRHIASNANAIPGTVYRVVR